MCEKCQPKIEYQVTITLDPHRREALGRAMGLVKLFSQKSENPRAREEWAEMYGHLEKISDEILDQIEKIVDDYDLPKPPEAKA